MESERGYARGKKNLEGKQTAYAKAQGPEKTQNILEMVQGESSG